MGEAQGTLFPLDFNRAVRVEARPERLSADAGALLIRELTDRLGLPELVARHLDDARDPDRVVHPFIELVRTALLLLVQGWRDQDDVSLLRDDPVLRVAVSGRRGEGPLKPAAPNAPGGLCSQPTLSRLQAALGRETNREGLAELLRELVVPFLGTEGAGRDEITLDLDSFPHRVHGHQPGTAYNGHYRARCFHPLVASVDGRYFLGGRLREGNVHTAEGGLDFVLPILGWLRGLVPRVWLRADAGFPAPEFLDRLDAEEVSYVFRLRSNATLERMARPFLRRPPGRPPVEGRTWFHEISYRAGSWSRARRVVLVVLERPGEQGHLFLDHFFLLTSATPTEERASRLLDRYRQRGAAESDFGAFKSTLALTLSSSPRPKSHYRARPVQDPDAYEAPDTFAANDARLRFALLASNVLAAGADLLSQAEKPRISRERLRTLLLKTATRVRFGERRLTFIIDRSRAPLWQRFLRRLRTLPLPRGSPASQALPTPA